MFFESDPNNWILGKTTIMISYLHWQSYSFYSILISLDNRLWLEDLSSTLHAYFLESLLLYTCQTSPNALNNLIFLPFAKNIFKTYVI